MATIKHKLKPLLCFYAFLMSLRSVESKVFTGDIIHSYKCSHFFKLPKVPNAYYTTDGDICCLCGKGRYWNADCSNGLPETTQCIECTYTEIYRSYIDYEPHDRTACFVDADCTPPRLPVGGSPTRLARCVCPAGMKPEGEDLCLPDDNLKMDLTNTAATTTSATVVTPASTESEPDPRKEDTASDGASQINPWLVSIIVVLVAAVCCYGVYRCLQNKRPTSDQSSKGSCSLSSSMSGFNQDPNQSSTALMPHPTSSHIFHFNEQSQSSNKATAIQRAERNNRVEEQLIPVHSPQHRQASLEEGKVRKAILAMSRVIVVKDLNRIEHLLGVPEVEIDNIRREHQNDTTERSTQVFLRYQQLHPETTLTDLQNLVAEYAYLKRKVDEVMSDA